MRSVLQAVHRAACTLLFAGLVPCALAAQEVAGRVTMRGDSAVAGGLVELLDERGRVAADAATGADGRFVVRAPAAGTWRVRAGQVGFQSAVSAPFTLAGGERRDVVLVIAPRVVALEGVSALGRPRCEATPTSGVELARVWDEARKALALTVRTAADSSVGFTFTTFARTTILASDSVVEDSATVAEIVGGVPFSSAPLDELDRHGFVRDLSDRMTFFGPDAQTILSPTFLAQHCFSLREGGTEREGQVGLAFEPVPARRHPDVSGVLWLDARSGELRRLEWGYTRVTAPAQREPRGHAEFTRLPNGAWIIADWALRLPEALSWFEEGRRRDGSRVVFGEVRAIREIGGTVSRVWTTDDGATP